jgi:hypothetical protein
LAVWLGVKQVFFHCAASLQGCFMSLHFQVYADFILSNGRPQFVGSSISSTKTACTSLPFYPFDHTVLTISRIFPTLQKAKSYIAYLHRVYPHSPAPPPILDGGQKELFPEVSK